MSDTDPVCTLTPTAPGCKTVKAFHELLAAGSWVTPSGTGYIVVCDPTNWLVGWQCWLQGSNVNKVVTITAINEATKTLSVTMASLSGNATSGVTINGPLTLTPIPYPLFDNPTAEDILFIPYVPNRVAVTVPTGTNTILLKYVKGTGSVMPDAGVGIFVDGIGWFETTRDGIFEGTATIDAVPYTVVIELQVKVVQLLAGVIAGTTSIPDGAFIWVQKYQPSAADPAIATIQTQAFGSYLAGNAGPYAPGATIALTAAISTSGSPDTFWTLNAGGWLDIIKTGTYMVSAFVRLDVTGVAAYHIASPVAALKVGSTVVTFGTTGGISTLEGGSASRLQMAVSAPLYIEEDQALHLTWIDQMGTANTTARNNETTGGTPSMLTHLHIVKIGTTA